MHIFFLVFLAALPLSAEEYQVVRDDSCRVRFTSKTQLDDFSGQSGSLDGFIYWRGAGLAGARELEHSRLLFELKLADFDTGIGLRNRHMREEVLETRLHPLATFTGRIARVEKAEGGAYLLHLEGQLALHGVERAFAAVVSASELPDGRIHLQGGFPITLAQFNIPRPAFLGLKIAAEVQVEVDFLVSAAEKK